MADMIRGEDVLMLKEKHPDGEVAAYVNTNAEVKAVSDVCETSAIAIKMIFLLSSFWTTL